LKTEINLWYQEKGNPITLTGTPRKATRRFVDLLRALGYPSLQPLIADLNEIGQRYTQQSEGDDNERKNKEVK